MNLLDPVSNDPAFVWNEKTSRHLLNRAGFGVPFSAVAKLSAMKPEAAVASFVDYELLPDVGPPPPKMPDRMSYKDIARKQKELGEMKARELRREYRKVEKETMVDLQTWWLSRMCNSQRPLQEKMTLFWHGHFATSAQKVQDPNDNYELNQVFRNQGMGSFRELVRTVGKSAAMMRYLDQQKSNKTKPNENWARELMELFTLGIGSYTEADIKDAARAFTGWYQRDGEFYIAPRQHDDGMKSILGVRAPFDGDEVVDLITARPECAQFICGKLWRSFAYDEPEPEIVAGLAETFKRNGGNIKPVLRQMFLSRGFYQEKAYFSQVKSPAQLVAGLMVQLDTEDKAEVANIAAYAMRAMGQSLFYPPNVKGWDGGRAWINTNTLLVRYNFSNFLVSGLVPDLKGQPGGGNVRREFLMAALGKKGDTTPSSDAMDGETMDGGMMAPAKDEDTMVDPPAGQDAMPRDIPARTFYNKLRERKQKAKSYPGMSKEERREAKQLDDAMKLAPFDARDFFSRYKGKPAAEIIDGLAHYFIGFSLDDNQRARLQTVLAQGTAPGKPVPVEKMAEEDLRATVQLLLSTVEYQVC